MTTFGIAGKEWAAISIPNAHHGTLRAQGRLVSSSFTTGTNVMQVLVKPVLRPAAGVIRLAVRCLTVMTTLVIAQRGAPEARRFSGKSCVSQRLFSHSSLSQSALW